MELFPFLCQPDQDEKQNDAGSNLYGSHGGIACSAGHGQFKHGSIHHSQPDEIPVILLDAPLIDRFRQELISLGRFRFRHAVEVPEYKPVNRTTPSAPLVSFPSVSPSAVQVPSVTSGESV